MNYRFTYKSRFERRNVNQKINKIFSDFIFSLYENKLFQKLKLDKNLFLKSHVQFGRKRSIPKLNKSKIPENPKLDIYSITLLDCIELENSQKLKNRLINIISKYKGGFLSDDPITKLNKAFKKFDSDYKTISWGNLFYNDTKDNEELNLIDGISYGYIKGAQSHFIITYTIFPSEKFKELFKESLKSEIIEEFEIKFKSLKQILRTKKLYTSINSDVKIPGFWIEKLFNEITFQFKKEVISSSKLGVFNLDKKVLFPRIISFEYDTKEFPYYKDELFHMLDISIHDYYTGSEKIFTLKNVDYSKKSSYGIEIFIPYKTDEEKRKDQFNAIAYLSSNYVQAIASYWTLINISDLRKQSIVELRKQTFKYIRKNKISLFLGKVIKLKNKLNLEWLGFERIRKDFTSDIFKRQLNLHGIPDSLNLPWIQGVQPDEFKKSLAVWSNYISNDIKNTYEEIIELHSHIAEDNSLRANMRLQRLLLFIAIIGIILAIYSANSHWFNSWIEYFLNKMNITIPKVINK